MSKTRELTRLDRDLEILRVYRGVLASLPCAERVPKF
jgi:hypothetical protein